MSFCRAKIFVLKIGTKNLPYPKLTHSFLYPLHRFTPPEDPLGRIGPSLHQFLRKSRTPSAPPCPYAKKCTYGSKCKYYHPFQPKSVSEVLRMKSAAAKTQSVPLTKNSNVFAQKECIMRTKSAATPTTSQQAGGEVRSHRKLARQLSINPYSEEVRSGEFLGKF